MLLNNHIFKSWYLFLLYWILMIFFGGLFFKESSENYNLTEINKIKSFIYLSVSFCVFFLSSAVVILILYFLNKKHPVDVIFDLDIYKIKIEPLIFLVFVSAAIFCYVFYQVGSVPLFSDQSGAKYFQSSQDLYIPYRPLYTLALNLASVSNTVILGLFLLSWKNGNKKNIIILLTLFFVSIFFVALTAKRGPILLPIAYVVFGLYLVGKIKTHIVITIFVLLVIISVLFHSIFISYGGEKNFFYSFINSYFVGVRELTRFFEFFDDKFLEGNTYIASLISFVPTEFSEFKSEFLYPRYLVLLEGGNPNLSGGPRGTFLGEAFANFGLMGIFFASILFGLLYPFVFYLVFIFSVCRCNSIILGIFLALIFQQLIMAFFENGSAFIFHFASKFIFMLIMFKLSLTNNRYGLNVKNSNRPRMVG